MLKNISPIISPELLKILMEMGHGDEIVVLTENGIAEQGSHAELMQKNGIYANMYNMYAIV